jgi:hypothetical protein
MRVLKRLASAVQLRLCRHHSEELSGNLTTADAQNHPRLITHALLDEHISILSIPPGRENVIFTVARVETVKSVAATEAQQIEVLIAISFIYMNIRENAK